MERSEGEQGSRGGYIVAARHKRRRGAALAVANDKEKQPVGIGVGRGRRAPNRRNLPTGNKMVTRGAAKTMKSTYMNTITMSMLLAMAGPQGWAELPKGILQSIIELLSCTRDILAFIATCTYWRAAFMEEKHSFCKLIPPLMIRSCAQLSNNAHSQVHHTWQLMDPADPNRRFHRPVPASIPPGMKFVGCSYGHAIFADLWVTDNGGRITMIDVFTGVEVSAPPCPELVKATTSPYLRFINLLCCTLTAPISSPKACLLVSSGDIVGSLLVWRIGSDDWQYTTSDYDGVGPIDQIVVFKGQIIALDMDLSLYRVHLDEGEAGQLGMSIRALLINSNDVVNGKELRKRNTRLVVCGDKLALLGSRINDWKNSLVFFHLDLDSRTEPARWLPVPEMDCALFISGARGSHARYKSWCGRWAVSRPDGRGGRRGHVAFAGKSDEVYPFASGRLLPSWVTPSVLQLEGY